MSNTRNTHWGMSGWLRISLRHVLTKLFVLTHQMKGKKTEDNKLTQKTESVVSQKHSQSHHRHEFCKPGGSIRSPSSGFCVFPRCAGDFEPRIQWWRVRLLWMALRPDNTSHCLFSMTEAGLWCSVLSWLPLLRAGLGCESVGEQERCMFDCFMLLYLSCLQHRVFVKGLGTVDWKLYIQRCGQICHLSLKQCFISPEKWFS